MVGSKYSVKEIPVVPKDLGPRGLKYDLPGVPTRARMLTDQEIDEALSRSGNASLERARSFYRKN